MDVRARTQQSIPRASINVIYQRFMTASLSKKKKTGVFELLNKWNTNQSKTF